MELATRSLGSCIARNVGESSLEPLAQADPTEQATPAMSKATKQHLAIQAGKGDVRRVGQPRGSSPWTTASV